MVKRSEINNEGRISTLEANYVSLNEKVDEIKDNHLVHLDAKIDRLQWWMFITAVGTLISIIVKLIK